MRSARDRGMIRNRYGPRPVIRDAIVAALREERGEYLNSDALVERVYDANGFPRPANPKSCIKVIAFHARPSLAAEGLVLEGKRGRRVGYYRLRHVAAHLNRQPPEDAGLPSDSSMEGG